MGHFPSLFQLKKNRISWLIFNWLIFFSIQAQTVNLQITNAKEILQVKIENGIPVVYSHSEIEYTATRHAVSFTASSIVNEFITLQKASSGQSCKLKYRSAISEDTFYEDARQAYFYLKLTGKGKSVKVKFDRKFCHLRYLSRIFIQDTYPAGNKDIIITSPHTLSGFNIIANHLPPNTTIDKGLTENGDSLWHFHFESLPPATLEYNQPAYSTVTPHLTITGGFKDWKDLYQWLLSLTHDKGNTETVQQKAKELTMQYASDRDKLTALYQWVQQNIRYIAFEAGIYAFRPEQPANVLQNKYGDCKGKSFLLKEMAQSIGLDVRLVWLHTARGIPSIHTLPSLASINHVICAFYDGKEYLYMDPTTGYLPLGVLPDYIQGKDVLVENGPTGSICHIPEDLHPHNIEEIRIHYRIKDNALEGTAQHRWKGMMKEYYARILNQSSENERTALYQQLLAGNRQENQLDSIHTTGETPADSVTSIQYKIRNKTDLQTAGKLILLHPNVLQPFISPIDTTQRKNDYLYSYRYEQTIHVTIVLPKDYQPESLPEDLDTTNNWFRRIRTCKVENNLITYRYRFVFLQPLIRLQEMEEFNRSLYQERVYASEQICLIHQPSTDKNEKILTPY